MLERLDSVLRKQCRVEPGALLVVGVSGGPDSLCLMHALHDLGQRLVVAHFNHRLRPEAEAEARAVEAAAARIAAPFASESADVRSHADAGGLSIEEAARQLRYGFLFAQARLHGASAVAVGHTADDQVETVLMHFIRGAGMDGLQGMSYRTVLGSFDPEIPVVRPLLDVWRDEILAYCEAQGLVPQHDPSNNSSDFLRNRLRNELIPLLETYNPQFRHAVWRTARVLASDLALLEERLSDEWEHAVIRRGDGFVAFDSAGFERSSRALQMQLIRRAAKLLAPAEEMTYSALERAAEFIADASAAHRDLAGGLELLREGAVIYVSRGESGLPVDAWPQMTSEKDVIHVSLGQCADLGGGWQFEAGDPQPVDAEIETSVRSADRFAVWLDADRLAGDLQLRSSHPGDRFEPLGLRGHTQKLSDFFVNEKLPTRARRNWPLLCSGDAVIWVPGYRPAESFSLGPASRRAVRFVVWRIG